MDNVSLNSTRNEPLLEAPCKIPGRQENYPAAQSRFREISRLAIGEKKREKRGKYHPPISGR
jgi:hypothetical protein